MKHKPIQTKITPNTVLSARAPKLTPLIQLWIRKNPGQKTSELVRRALKKELAPLAGKRYAHLVAA